VGQTLAISFPLLSCPEYMKSSRAAFSGVRSKSLDCFALPLRGMKAKVEYHMLAKTIKPFRSEEDSIRHKPIAR